MDRTTILQMCKEEAITCPRSQHFEGAHPALAPGDSAPAGPVIGTPGDQGPLSQSHFPPSPPLSLCLPLSLCFPLLPVISSRAWSFFLLHASASVSFLLFYFFLLASLLTPSLPCTALHQATVQQGTWFRKCSMSRPYGVFFQGREPEPGPARRVLRGTAGHLGRAHRPPDCSVDAHSPGEETTRMLA